MKKCIICNLEKINDEYHKDKSRVDGYSNKCKLCVKEKQKIYRADNIENAKIAREKWYSENKEYAKEYSAIYRINNSDKIKKTIQTWVEENKDLIKQYQQKSNKKNSYKYKERIRNYNKEYMRKRRLDPLYKLQTNIKSSISNAIKLKGFIKKAKTINILGCSFEEFKTYLESKFEPWMNWDNYGKFNGSEGHGWDVDHIIPLASAINEDDIIKLNHFTNLQPLCSYINRNIKRDKH